MISDREISDIILSMRLQDPDLPRRMAQKRQKPSAAIPHALVLVAADHPARRTVAAGSNAWAMANRPDLLRRLARVLMQPYVDGALVTPDIMDELWMLQAWVANEGGPDFLAGKWLIGSMNRGGLAGTVFELDDFVSAYTAQALVTAHMDAGKLLLRMDSSMEASSQTLQYVVDALQQLDTAELPVFLEPIPIPLSVDELVRLLGVATGLGPSSRRRWLKVPMLTPFSRIAAATTCPLVLLGGADAGPGEEILRRVAECLHDGPNIRGVLMGRGVLYPADGRDPRGLLQDLASLLQGRNVKEMVEWPFL